MPLSAAGKRGADALVRTLAAAGVKRVFALSGNHIMAVFDAALDAGIDLLHVRHEAAAVHMADAWGRLTGESGVALVTGGPGHANAVGALYTALGAESPLVLLSGHAPLAELDRGSFQELRQADMAAPVAKASWTATSAASLSEEVARALRVAKAGRPGPVHLSLPTDVLEDVVEAAVPAPDAFSAPTVALDAAAAQAALAQLAGANRPLILTGPLLTRERGRALAEALAAATGVPVVGMESPRGLADPTIGAFVRTLPKADVVLLLDKPLDFALRLGDALPAGSRLIQIDPEPEAIRRTASAVGERLALSTVADPLAAAERLIEVARGRAHPNRDWFVEVQTAVRQRPAEWATLRSQRDDAVHPVELCRAVQAVLDRDANAVLVADGGEYCQWAQACLRAPHRIINGPAGSIGSALPFAIAARLAFPDSTVIAMIGDGTFGFHMTEYETAVRRGLPFVAVVGNDARWNAEHQIQLKAYGAERAVVCELLPSRYDQVAAALGGHGEHVTRVADLPGALERALHSGKPACVNVAIEGLAAPRIG